MKTGPGRRLVAPGVERGTEWAPGQSSSSPGPQPGKGGCQRQRTRPQGASGRHPRPPDSTGLACAPQELSVLELDERLRLYCRDTAAAMSVACCLARASQGLGSLFHFRHGALADNPPNRPPPPVLNSEMAIFGPGGHLGGTYMYVVVLRNGPLLGRCYCLTGPYLLFICPTCLVIALEPRRAQVLPLLPPPGPRLCGLCELRYGPWGVALLLLHLLLLLTGGKENLAVCHQHKHPCCCCCCRRLFLPPAAFAAAVVAALPSWWSCCSSCCPSCAHHPYVSF